MYNEFKGYRWKLWTLAKGNNAKSKWCLCIRWEPINVHLFLGRLYSPGHHPLGLGRTLICSKNTSINTYRVFHKKREETWHLHALTNSKLLIETEDYKCQYKHYENSLIYIQQRTKEEMSVGERQTCLYFIVQCYSWMQTVFLILCKLLYNVDRVWVIPLLELFT